MLPQYTHYLQWSTLGGGIPQEGQYSLIYTFHVIHSNLDPWQLQVSRFCALWAFCCHHLVQARGSSKKGIWDDILLSKLPALTGMAKVLIAIAIRHKGCRVCTFLSSSWLNVLTLVNHLIWSFTSSSYSNSWIHTSELWFVLYGR